jgi:glycosyltransferase involved in cell wall biosynthesis
MQFTEEELRLPSRSAARMRLNISPEVFLISSFGFVGKEKGMDVCIIATELLRGWNIPAELHFVGDALGLSGAIEYIARSYGIEDHVHTTKAYVEKDRYRDYMLASDAAIQLRGYGLGQFSAALTDCISAALPCVASKELALACDAPDYVLKMPDCISPLHVAEGLAEIWESRQDRTAFFDAQRAFLRVHNYDCYVKRLREILELE